MPTLNWVGKDKVVNHHHDVPFRVLEHKKSFRANVETPTNSTDNRIIHGDNLEALKSLLPEFEGKVDCIYIDPPYNTGNEGWVYNDNVNDPKLKKWLGQVVGKEGEDLSRHDKWLCMMYPRLKLLRRLLTADGVIFVSIDDVEITLLRLIMDEIFTPSKFIGQFIWKSRQNKDNRTKTGASIDHEYVLCYGSEIRGATRDLSGYSNDDLDSRGSWTSGNMVGLASKEARPNLHYDLIDPATGINYGCPRQGWRYDSARMTSMIKDKCVLWPKKKDGRPREKVFLDHLSSEHTGFSSILPTDIFTYHGTREIEQIFGQRVFDFPKSSDFVGRLIEQATHGKLNALVLDSFAGSGTTAHAVLKLNAEDQGSRRFILIETMDYAETITAERVRRVMNGYGPATSPVAPIGGGFDYYTVGEPIFLETEMLNDAVGIDAIRNYVAYSEGIPQEHRCGQDNPYTPDLLGLSTDMGWVFNYRPDEATALDLDYLSTLNFGAAKPSAAIIYADRCLLTKEFLSKHGIIFKKIPRDITRF